MIHRKSQLSVPNTRNPYIRHSIYCNILYIRVCTQLHPCMWGVSRRFQEAPGPPGPSRGLQGPPGASGASFGASQNPKTFQNVVLNEKAAYSQSPEPLARLKFHAGWSGWTRPPTMAGGGGGGGQAEAFLQRRVEGVFKGI